jgi:hypothetical protein
MPRRDLLPALALALPLEKLVLVAALAWMQPARAGAAA